MKSVFVRRLLCSSEDLVPKQWKLDALSFLARPRDPVAIVPNEIAAAAAITTIDSCSLGLCTLFAAVCQQSPYLPPELLTGSAWTAPAARWHRARFE